MPLPLPNVVQRSTIRLMARVLLDADLSMAQLRRRAEVVARLSPPQRGTVISSTTLAGVPAEIHTPRSVVSGRVLLYLHGGGYCIGSPRTHRGIASRLAAGTRALTYVLDYRLAPEHRFPAAIDDTISAYQALLEQGWRGDQIMVAGDSAGGGLALALAVTARDRGMPAPAALGLISPGIDVTPNAEGLLDAPNRDPMLGPEILVKFVEAFTSDTERLDQRLSPLYADLRGLPPLIIDTAEHDMIADQARQLRDLARIAGNTVRYREHPNRGHVFHVLAGIDTRADLALAALARDLAGALDKPLDGVAS